MRPWFTLVCVVLVLGVACSSTPSLPEYAETVEELVTIMNSRIDAADTLYEANPTVENVQRYATDRMAARSEFIELFGALDPPEEVADLHAAALGILTRLAAAEAEWAALALEVDSAVGLDDLWTSVEIRAVRAVDEEAVAICIAAQSELDATAERETLSDVPWIPPEMKEVIVVAFRCSRQER